MGTLFRKSEETLFSSLFLHFLLVLLNGGPSGLPTTFGSEFPERECCDPVYPIQTPGSSVNAGHGAIAPAAFPEYVPPSPASSLTTELPGVQTKTVAALLDCLQAQNYCKDNTACSPILEIVPRVCGPEKVACTTLTVTKCQAALRTLQAFPYFYPTCLCRVSSVDPVCNAFREYLFEHPCSIVKKKDGLNLGYVENDPYPVDALPTCDYAMNVCKEHIKCHQLYRDFKQDCPVTGSGVCKMDDGELCHNAWTKLRLSPMFGCICPNGGIRCERLFKEVNYNPCVAFESAFDFNGTTSALYSLENERPRSFLHYSYNPTSLFPKPGTHMHRYYQSPSQHNQLSINAPHQSKVDSTHFGHTESRDDSSSTTTISPISYHHAYYPSLPGSFSTSQYGSITVQVIPATSLASNHELDSQLETPLLGPTDGYSGGESSLIQTDGLTEHKSPPPFMPPPIVIHQSPSSPPHKSTMTRGEQSNRPQQRHSAGISTSSSVRSHGGSVIEKQSGKVPLQTTCFTALQNCRKYPTCSKHIQQVLHWCDASRCRQDTCMQALRTFYREVPETHAVEVAFCLCRKSENRADQECLHAQRQLHPVCAQRGDLGISPPSCHSLAATCRDQLDCKNRLELYEKACAVDSVTRKCAGPTSYCRNATVGILGTVLKQACACNGTDYNKLYDCVGWQRILWVNPCVLESQRDYHRVRSTSTVTSLVSTKSGGGSSTIVSQMSVDTESYSQEGVILGEGGREIQSTTSHGNSQIGIPIAVDSRPHAEYYPEKTTTTILPTPSPTTPTSTTSARQHRTSISRQQNSRGNGDISHSEIILYGSTTSTSSPNRIPVIMDEFTTLSSTITKSQTLSTTPPPKYCVVQRPNQNPQIIVEGLSRRFYRDDRPTCSEFCTCTNVLSPASCTVIACLDSTKSLSCSQKQRDNKTIMYSHGAISYQANRGKCVCYAGSFVCVRPLQEKYNLNRGVFLFIGFSKVDQEVMRPHTNVEAARVIETLRNLINPDLHHHFANPADEGSGIEALREVNTSECHLGLFKEEDENLIINATISDEEFGNFTLRHPKDELLIEEKRKCGPVLLVLSTLINEKKGVIQSHPLLSILKLAEVAEYKIPNTRSSAMNLRPPFFLSSWYCTTTIGFLVFLFNHFHQRSILFLNPHQHRSLLSFTFKGLPL